MLVHFLLKHQYWPGPLDKYPWYSARKLCYTLTTGSLEDGTTQGIESVAE